MDLVPPLVLAAVLAVASLTSANAQAPTKLQRSRISGGPVTVPLEPTLVAAATVEAPATSPEYEGPRPASTERIRSIRRRRRQMPPVQAQPKSPPRASRAQIQCWWRKPRPPPRPRPRVTGSPATTSGATGGAMRSCTAVDVDPTTILTLGKSRVVRLPFPATRLIVGGQPGSSVGTAGGASRAAEPAAGAMPGSPAAMARPPVRRRNSARGPARTPGMAWLAPTSCS